MRPNGLHERAASDGCVYRSYSYLLEQATRD